MELQAAIEGLRAANYLGHVNVELISDSKYVLKGIAQWIRQWKRNGWHKGGSRVRGTVKNVVLWKRLDAEVEGMTSIRFKWVKGHNGVVFNEVVDDMADYAARSGGTWRL
jgi:ribonuclease HI